MKLVYIAHPLGRDPTKREMNRIRATTWVGWAAEQGVAPIAPWITLAGLWSETKESRELGLKIDCIVVARCDELWLVGGQVSPGMKIEAEAAKVSGVKVVDMTELGEWPPS